MNLRVMEGDILDQEVEVIVNAWNRNLIPWWLLWPQGVSRAIRKKAGNEPFKELRKHGVLPLGGAVMTGAGRLPLKGIIHVAGIGHDWIASEKSIRLSVRNALHLAQEKGIRSIAFPLIGAGTGGGKEDQVFEWMSQEAEAAGYDGDVIIVIFKRRWSEGAGC